MKKLILIVFVLFFSTLILGAVVIFGRYLFQIKGQSLDQQKHIYADNAEGINFSNWQFFKNTDSGYMLRYPNDWTHIVADKFDTVDSFSPRGVSTSTIKCNLSIEKGGVMGHETELKKSNDEIISVAGIQVTKRNWMDNNGYVVYYNFEISKTPDFIGMEAFIDPKTNCASIIQGIINSFQIIL
jgi:hypothetical protein